MRKSSKLDTSSLSKAESIESDLVGADSLGPAGVTYHQPSGQFLARFGRRPAERAGSVCESYNRAEEL